MTRWRLFVRVSLVAALCSSLAAGAKVTRPRLLVVLVVDQMRADYVDRFAHEWTSGLHRLLTEGAWFREAEYPYFDTMTCPGHTTIATGTLPSVHTMVLNVWWDPTEQREVRCTEDEKSSFVSYGYGVAGPADSAVNIRATTIADALEAESRGASHVVAFSLKARAAIPLGGHHPDAVTWFDDSGTWVTSSAFANAPVVPVADYIRQHPIDAPNVARWQQSPRSDEYLAQMGLSVAGALQLGKGEATNFLGIGFSALDLVGHAFGPDSPQVRQTLLALDRTVGILLRGLDELVGVGNYTVVLVSDHGVAPVPEQMRARGIDAGRMTPAAFAARINAAISAVAGPGRYVSHVVNTHVYLNAGAFERLQDQARLAAIRTKIRALPFVSDVFTRDQIARAQRDESTEGRIARSYDPARSGDIVVVLRPYWLAYAAGTTHGTAYGYDSRVPLVLFGSGIRPGRYMTPVSPMDVAPTLARLAGVVLPEAQGRALTEALQNARNSRASE